MDVALTTILDAPSLVLDFETEKKLGQALQATKAEGADAVLAHLAQIQLAHSNAYADRRLADVLLDYSQNPHTEKFLLRWSPALVTHKPVLARVQILTDADVTFYKNLIKTIIATPAIDSGAVNDLLVAIAVSFPDYLASVLSVFGEIQTPVDLGALFETTTETRAGVEALFDSLGMIGAVSPNSQRIAKALFVLFPDRIVAACLAYLKGGKSTPYFFDEVMKELARTCSIQDLPTLLAGYDALNGEAVWTQSFIKALFENKNLSLDTLINSTAYFALYRNIASHLSSIIEGHATPDRRYNVADIVMRILQDPGIEKLDKAAFWDMTSALNRKMPDGDFNAVRLMLLARVPFAENFFLSDEFFLPLLSYAIPAEYADAILQKMRAIGKDPFNRTDFLAHLLDQCSPVLFRTFVFQEAEKFMQYPTGVEKLFLLLGEKDSQHFSWGYIKRSSKYKKYFGAYSENSKEIYKRCYLHLTFWEKIKAMFC